MTKSWPSGNSYLRLLSSGLQNPSQSMTIYTLSEREQLLVSQAIQQYVKHMTSIGVEVLSHMTNGKESGEKKFSLSVSREMST